MLREASNNNYKYNKEKMAQIMFETFNVKGLYIVNPAILSMYSAGKFNGIVCDSGDGVTQMVPISDGYPLHSCINRLDIAGRDITYYLIEILKKLYN